MTQTKKKTLTFLGITIILLLCFIVSFAGQKTEVASADSTSVLNATEQKLNSVMSNGEVHGKISTEGTKIETPDQLRAFLSGGSGKGYLAKDITDFSWDGGKFTRRLMSENVTELNGNGFTITLTATQLADSQSSPEIGVADGDDKAPTPYTVKLTNFYDGALNTYAGTRDTRANLDVHAGLIGYLRPNQTIKNCKFVYNKSVDLSYATRNCGTFGLIVGYSLGTIDNCSLSIGGNVKMFKDTNWTGSVANYYQETLSKHSFAMGGYVGTMSSNAVVSNSKIVLNGNLELQVQGRNKGSNEYLSNHARAWTGGIVGWIANDSKIFNIVTEGNGNLDARCVNPQKSRTRSFSGIIAGISADDLGNDEKCLAGDVLAVGTIKGVINNWTGYAKYLTEDTSFSPTNVKDNSIQYLVIGAAGQNGYATSNVSDIFMNKNVYSGTTFSVGFDYSAPKGIDSTSVNQGRYYSTNIIVRDVLDKPDGSVSYSPASDQHGYLAFSGTEESSPLWAVYDLKGNENILWSKTVTNESTGKTDLEYYYDQVTSIEDAKKYDITHTEIPKGQNQNYTIDYAHGKAVYFEKVYNGDVIDPFKEYTLDSTRYGSGLTAPTLSLYYDKAHTRYIRDLSDNSYWVSIGSKNNVPVQMSGGIVSPDTYKSFLFIESANGRNYNYIQFVNTTYRYVSYIYDDPVFQTYKEKHPDYEPVRNGVKQIDWQQRIVQEVKPKLVSITWGRDSDIKEREDSEYIYDEVTGEIISYGQYTTDYDGDTALFNITIPSDSLILNETCQPNYEYRMLDNYTGEYSKVDSCVNAGTYKVVVTSLSNGNYELAGAGLVDYSIDFVIEKRKIGFINNKDAEVRDDAYYIEVTYEARDMTLAEEVEFFATKQQAETSKAKIAIYNVLERDKRIVQFNYNPYGDGQLDMRNVGMFEMEMSLLGGINSGNYIMPDISKYIVKIVQAEVKLNKPEEEIVYPYGFMVKDRVDPYVTAIGVDKTQLTFDGLTYYKREADGKFYETNQEPFDAGVYQIKYDFLSASYSNYKDASITVDVTIKPREVKATYTNKEHSDTFAYGESISSVDLTFQRQTGESGIFAYEYSMQIKTFRFNKLDDKGFPTDIWVDEIIDAGGYLVEVGLDFKVGTTSSGWQTNEHTKDNYTVLYDPYTIYVNKRPIYIDIKDYTREYGDALPEFIGDANASDDVRAWTYSKGKENNSFFEGDNIVVLPFLSDMDIYAYAGKYYTVRTSYDKEHMSDKEHLENPDLDTYNKIDNYEINILSNGKYTINPRTVKVKVFLNTDSVVYGDALPEFLEARVVGEKDFFEKDGIQLIDFWDGVEVGSPVDTYEVTVKIKEMSNDMHKNYVLVKENALFDIIPRTLTIIGADVEGAREFIFDGEVQKPSVIPRFAEELVGNDVIEFNYNYFEIIDGVMSVEATENPQYAGTYRVFIDNVSNKNYTVVFGKDYVRGEIYMTIKPRNVSIDVLPAYRIYSIEGSLTPIMRGEINEDPNHHYYTKEEAEEIYGEAFYKPYSYAQDTEHHFVQNELDLNATMYIDEYYSQLGVKRGVVKLVFNGLVPDPNAVDKDGNWLTQEIVGSNGEIIQIIMPKYRNYNITMNFGDLHVLGANLKDVGQYVNLRNTEEVYNGQDRYDDFRVLTSNENIANALKFRVFKYVAISALSKAEADSLAKAYGKYTRSEEDGKYVYTRDDAEGAYVRKYFRRIENGDSVDDKLVDAGQYFKHITPANTDIFTGEYITDFYITKAVRQVSADDIKVSVNYNQISLSSKIEGMEVSFNGATFVNRNTFVDLKPNTDYTVKVRFASTANYLQSEEIEFKLHTGIDISAIISTLEKFDKIDFSNIAEYEEKVLAFIGNVSQDDMSRIDQAKYAKLQASYEQLLRGANNVIAGAQKAGATAVGKSGKTSVAKTVALSMSGAGILFAGLMCFAKKKKDDEQDAPSSKKAKRAGVKRASKVMVMAVAVILVCLTVFAGCDPSNDGGFSKSDLYKIASYQSDVQTGSRDLIIEVKSSGTTLYKYENGKEEIDPRLDVSSISFGADGVGFEFDDLYFTNSQFTTDGDTATFKADVKETLVFLGVSNAVNGKVTVTVNTATEKLNTIDVSYDVVNGGITYNVTIAVKAK